MSLSSSLSADPLQQIATEARNPHTTALDRLPTLAMLTMMHEQDAQVVPAITPCLPILAALVDEVSARLQQGGRLFYVGAGTSGRLGVLDAAECPPTFSVPPTLVQGIIAGGEQALTSAVEGAEDDTQSAEQTLRGLGLSAHDTVIGIAASGRTPYVIRALETAKECGALTAVITTSPGSPMTSMTGYTLCADVGPECLTGSTRLKSGTAQKLLLNMISTACMVKLGKVYSNLMVDVKASNHKLRLRAQRIVMMATDCDITTASTTLAAANGDCKTAIIMLLCGLPAVQASSLLAQHHGVLRSALQARDA